ncbi:MAG: ATP-binding cassette domain-containing protein, partial [Sphingomonadales bacterium]|nr:ATP-binding cassette domain-containing protein [Sphingomonadales bacterium]
TLATLQPPDSGSITFDGVDVLANPDYLRARLGYLPQTLGAYPGVSGRNLLNRLAVLKGYANKAEREAEADHLLHRVNLAEAADRAVSTYSGGMLRRFGIAAAFIGSPKLLIVDEPTAGLDPTERRRFHRVLADFAADAIVLLSTHIIDDVENLCANLSILAQGMILAAGTPAELKAPLEGRLWTKIVPDESRAPDNTLHETPTPEGLRYVVEMETAPDDSYVTRRPRLEDVYHKAIGALENRHAPAVEAA